MRTVAVLAAIVAQVAALVYLGGEREWILRRGHTLLLRTAPRDPRDAMRGDYIHFNYEEARVPKSLCKDEVKTWFVRDRGYESYLRRQHDVRDRVVYATVRLDDNGIANVTGVSDRRPAEGLFLRARAVDVNDDTLNIRFGTEAKFTQQGAARAFDEAAAKRPGAPVDVEVAVGRDGTAVLKSYQWEPLGITVEVDRPPRPATASSDRRVQPGGLRGVTVKLTNYGDHPLAIVAQPNGKSFRLIRNDLWGESRFAWIGEETSPPKPRPDMVRVLPPGATYSEHLDFTAPEWFIREIAKPNQSPRAMSETNGWDMSFRLEYAPPSAADCAALPNAELIRHGRLRSRGFVGGAD